jgi:hypothetical protein
MTQQRPSRTVIGDKTVLVDDDEFVLAYDQGHATYYRYHRDEKVIDAALLAFQIQSGSGPEMRPIGAILGWLAAFFEQEEGQLARTVDIHTPDTERDEQDSESA